ncbi:MAG: EFR1 family ferrodoxin [Muribaculaceae bacterium]|nr:EFR1 family ferrodoxin [Muribaculaceae bacterium]
MIYYFSGTGNSRYSAEYLGNLLEDRVENICKISASEIKLLNERWIGFVFPVYSWGVPPIVEKFISDLSQSSVDYLSQDKVPIWMVATCGDDTGYTHKMLDKILGRRNLKLKGIWNVIMPNIYVLLPGFDVDSDAVRIKKIREIDKSLDVIAGKILRNEWEVSIKTGSFPWLKTAVVYPLFMKWGININKWHVTDKCTGCGLCAKACPVNNITIQEGRPIWGSNCLSCVSCYHECPHHAVEYGKITKLKGQYKRSQRPTFSRK